jgi:dienelactone hydrolase
VRTTIIAFGGYLYSIAKWLPAHVIHYSSMLWGFTDRWCQNFAMQISQPVILIGFSEGANAALQVASHSPMVTRAIVHSCEDKPVGFNAACDYRFFATLTDLTPTLEGTIATAQRARHGCIRSELTFLPSVAFEKPTWFERKVLAPRNHIFHNLLPYLPALGV